MGPHLPSSIAMRKHIIAPNAAKIPFWSFSVLACDNQIKMMPFGMDNLVLIEDDTRRKTYEIGQRGGGGVNTAKREWGVGELEFEALMRKLDNAVSSLS